MREKLGVYRTRQAETIRWRSKVKKHLVPPTRLGGGHGFTRTVFAEANSQNNHLARREPLVVPRWPTARRARFHLARAVSMVIPRMAAISHRLCPWISFKKNTSRCALGNSRARR